MASLLNANRLPFKVIAIKLRFKPSLLTETVKKIDPFGIGFFTVFVKRSSF